MNDSCMQISAASCLFSFLSTKLVCNQDVFGIGKRSLVMVTSQQRGTNTQPEDKHENLTVA